MKIRWENNYNSDQDAEARNNIWLPEYWEIFRIILPYNLMHL